MHMDTGRRTVQRGRGINLITWATGVRWFGWGLFETLVPVFLFSFSQSFAQTGFFKSIYYIFFLLAAPFAGLLADKIRAKHIIILGLCAYPLIGLSYFLAGFMGLAIFIVLARALNGAAYAFDAIGRHTYFRRHVPASRISSAFGYFDVISSGLWIIAAGLSIFLVRSFAIHELALAIIPTTFITILMISLVPEKKRESTERAVRDIWEEGIFKTLWKEVKSWSKGMRYVALANFFIGFIAVVADFIVPIKIFEETGSYVQVIVIGIIITLPALFDFNLGKFADKHRVPALFAGLSAIFLLIVALSFTSSFVAQMVIAFLLTLSSTLVNLASDGLATVMVKPDHYGRMGGINVDIDTFGAIFGSILIGVIIDAMGFSFAMAGVGAFCLLVLLALAKGKRYLRLALDTETT